MPVKKIRNKKTGKTVKIKKKVKRNLPGNPRNKNKAAV